MSKDEGRRGNPALPTGQTRGGFSGEDTSNPKGKSSMMSVPAPGDPMTRMQAGERSIANGFRDADESTMVKVNGPDASYDGRVVANYEQLVDGGGIPTTNPGANRQKWGLPTPTPPVPKNGVDLPYGPAPTTGKGDQS